MQYETWCHIHFYDGSVLSWPSYMFYSTVHQESIKDMVSNCAKIVVREELIPTIGVKMGS